MLRGNGETATADMTKSSRLFWRRLRFVVFLFHFQSSPFSLAAFWPLIGRVARYSPSSRPKIASKTKANLETHKSLDDFIAGNSWFPNSICTFAFKTRSYGQTTEKTQRATRLKMKFNNAWRLKNLWIRMQQKGAPDKPRGADLWH